MTLSIVAEHCYAECRLCWLSLASPIYWVSRRLQNRGINCDTQHKHRVPECSPILLVKWLGILQHFTRQLGQGILTEGEGWPPCTNQFRSAAFYTETIFFFFTKQAILKWRSTELSLPPFSKYSLVRYIIHWLLTYGKRWEYRSIINRAFMLCSVHRHLRKINWLMVHTACLVCPNSTVNGRIKKALEEQVLAAGT